MQLTGPKQERRIRAIRQAIKRRMVDAWVAKQSEELIRVGSSLHRMHWLVLQLQPFLLSVKTKRLIFCLVAVASLVLAPGSEANADNRWQPRKDCRHDSPNDLTLHFLELFASEHTLKREIYL